MLQYAVVISATSEIDCDEIEEMIEAAGYQIVRENIEIDNYEAVQMWVFSKFDKLQHSFRWTYTYQIDGPFFRMPIVLCHRMPLKLRWQYRLTAWAFLLKSELLRMSKLCLDYLSSQLVRRL